MIVIPRTTAEMSSTVLRFGLPDARLTLSFKTPTALNRAERLSPLRETVRFADFFEFLRAVDERGEQSERLTGDIKVGAEK